MPCVYPRLLNRSSYYLDDPDRELVCRGLQIRPTTARHPPGLSRDRGRNHEARPIRSRFSHHREELGEEGTFMEHKIFASRTE